MISDETMQEYEDTLDAQGWYAANTSFTIGDTVLFHGELCIITGDANTEGIYEVTSFELREAFEAGAYDLTMVDTSS